MSQRRHKKFLIRESTPSPAARLARRGAWWVLLALLGLLLITAVAYYRLLAYLQGDEFREDATSALYHVLKAEKAQLGSNLNVDGNRITLAGVMLQRQGVLQKLHAEGIRAEVDRSALLDRELHLKKLTMESVFLALDADQSAEPLTPIQPTKAHFWLGLLPRTLRLDSLECKDADLHVHFHGQDYALLSSNVAAMSSDKWGHGAWQVKLTNGKARLPFYFLQDCSVKSASLTRTSKRFSLTDCRISLTPGELRITAEAEPDTGNWSADFRVNKAHVSRVLNEDWKKRLTGELFGELKMFASGGRLTRAAGSFALQQGELEGLPVLSDLKLGSTRPYRTISLEKAEWRVSFPYSEPKLNIDHAWLIDHLDLRSRGGTLRVRGHVVIGQDRSLGGTLNIGLSEQVLSNLSPQGAALLASIATGSHTEEGYLWVNLNLSGTVDDPQEDLSVRLSTLLRKGAAAAADGLLKTVDNVVADRLQEAPESSIPAKEDTESHKRPSQPTDAMQEATKDAARTLRHGLFSFF